VTDSPVLSAEETSVAESVLGGVWGTRVTVRSAEKILSRSHVVRLRLADDRTVVLKRRRSENFGGLNRSFDAELAALEFLNGMAPAVAPRLFGADPGARILVMEDLGLDASLAHSLLARDSGRAEADLVAYARALGRMHAWSFGRSDEFAEIRTRHGSSAPAPTGPQWLGAITSGKESFLAVAGRCRRAGRKPPSLTIRPWPGRAPS
jgi:hypothetical protein